MKYYLIILSLFSSSGYCDSFTGHFKSHGVITADAPTNSMDRSLWNNQVVTKGFYDLSENLSFEGAYQLDLVHTKSYSSPLNENESLLPYRAIDVDLNPYVKNYDGGSSLYLFQNINKLNFSYSVEKYEFILGRQSVSFGSGRVAGPMDIWAPFGITKSDTEDRSGVDSLRLKVPIGEMGQFDSGVVISDSSDQEQIHGFMDLKLSSSDIDYEFNISRFYRNHLTALGLQGYLFGAGIWLEGALNLMDDKKNYLRVTCGAEYSFTPLFVGSFEYHYNGAGQSDSHKYLTDLSDNDGFLEGAVFFLGQNYIIPSVSWAIHPLVSLSSNIIVNLSDMSQYYSLKVEYNLAEDFYIDGGTYVSGSSGKYSEYGKYSDTLFASLRSYF